MSHTKWHLYSNERSNKPWSNRQLQREMRADLEFDKVILRERARREKARLRARERRARLKALAAQNGPGAEVQHPGPQVSTPLDEQQKNQQASCSSRQR